MPIHSQVAFIRHSNESPSKQIFHLDHISVEEIETNLLANNQVVIINTFEGDVSLQDMINSTTTSIQIMNQVSKPIEIIAIMERKSTLKMAIIDIKKTKAITNFASHPNRGKTFAVMYEKSITKFFLTMANQLLPDANFIITDHIESAYAILENNHQANQLA
ncbi:MAG: hypothetical protein AAFV93_08245 [Chloroflexota bacterium]